MKKRPLKSLQKMLQDKTWFNLSLVLSLWSFAMLTSVAIITAIILILAHQFGFIRHSIPGFGLLVTLVACVALGTVEAAFICRRSTRSITNLNKAMGEVAHGNFDIRLDEDYCTEELRGMTVSFNKMVHELGVNEMFRNDFIANVSHEFKTPLAAIEGYVTLLQDDSLSPQERDEYIKKITETTRRLSDMTGNILFLSRLENQSITPPSTEFELDEQIRQTVLELEPKWSQKDINLDIDLDPVKCVAPKEFLRHIWLNLIDNAIKFTPKGGTIALRLSSQGGMMTASVSDTGIGMTQQEQEHIFEKFYQADRSHGSEGNGLGLALVSRIAKVCGGNVSVKSISDLGSTFTVTLPQNCTKA